MNYQLEKGVTLKQLNEEYFNDPYRNKKSTTSKQSNQLAPNQQLVSFESYFNTNVNNANKTDINSNINKNSKSNNSNSNINNTFNHNRDNYNNKVEDLEMNKNNDASQTVNETKQDNVDKKQLFLQKLRKNVKVINRRNSNKTTEEEKNPESKRDSSLPPNPEKVQSRQQRRLSQSSASSSYSSSRLSRSPSTSSRSRSPTPVKNIKTRKSISPVKNNRRSPSPVKTNRRPPSPPKPKPTLTQKTPPPTITTQKVLATNKKLAVSNGTPQKPIEKQMEKPATADKTKRTQLEGFQPYYDKVIVLMIIS